MGYIRDIYFTHFLTFDPNFLGDPTIHDLDPFFLPLQMVLASLGLIVAASGGIGGGGILVPLFMLVLELRRLREWREFFGEDAGGLTEEIIRPQNTKK